MNARSWKFKRADDQEVNRIADLTGVPVPLAKALALRKHGAEEDLENFLNPRLAALSDPFLQERHLFFTTIGTTHPMTGCVCLRDAEPALPNCA